MLQAPGAIHWVELGDEPGEVEVNFDPTRSSREILDYFEDMLTFLASVKGTLNAIAPQHREACHPHFVALASGGLKNSLSLKRVEPQLRDAIRQCSQGQVPEQTGPAG